MKKLVKKIIYDTIFGIFSVVFLGLIVWWITNTVLVPKTDINVTCNGIIDTTSPVLKSIGVSSYLSLNFTNNADFAGEDFNIIITNVDYSYLKKFYGLFYADDFLCKPIENQYNFAYFKCDYIPPKSSIELRLLPYFNNFNIIYWSKTTKKTEKDIFCN